jgi:hypothetical protein
VIEVAPWVVLGLARSRVPFLGSGVSGYESHLSCSSAGEFESDVGVVMVTTNLVVDASAVIDGKLRGRGDVPPG